MAEEDTESVYSDSSAEGDAFCERLEAKDWTFVKRKYNRDYFMTGSSGFLSDLLRLDAPTEFIQKLYNEKRGSNHDLLPQHKHIRFEVAGAEDAINLPLVTVASIFSCDETFEFIMEQTRVQAESYEALNPYIVKMHGPTQIISDVGLIPLPRLRILSEAFQTRYSDSSLVNYLFHRKNERAPENSLESMEKFILVLNWKLNLLPNEEKETTVQYDDQGNLLVPHTLFQLFLSEPFCGDDSKKLDRKKQFIDESPTILQYLRDNLDRLPEGYALEGLTTHGDSLLHIVLRNVSYRRVHKIHRVPDGRLRLTSSFNFNSNLPKEDSLRELTRWIVQSHPDSLGLRDRNGCLPIHIAAQEGIPVEEILIRAFPEGLRQRQSCFYPFQLAALSLKRSMHQRDNEHLLDIEDLDDHVEIGEWRKQRSVERTFRFLIADPTVLDLCYGTEAQNQREEEDCYTADEGED